MKKVFIISAILLGVVLLFLGIYNFAFRKDSTTAQQVAVVSTEEPKTNEPIKPEKITAISDGAVLGVVIDNKTEEIKYYDALSGIVWGMDSDGKNKQKITDTKITGLKKVLWSRDQNKVLTTMQKEGQASFSMYDYQSRKASPLKNELETIVWDNLGTKIFYKYFDTNTKKGTLNIANPDGRGWQAIADTSIRYISIAPIPLASMVSFWNSPYASQETQLQIVSVTGGEVKTILNGKYGADYLWSPDGSKALVSSLLNKNSNLMTLGVVSIDGEYRELGVPTMVSKCAWSQDGKTVYYALAGGIPDDAVMPNDYQDNKFNTNDTFWKINIVTGEKERVIEVDDIKEKFDSTAMLLSSTEDALYFVNKINQKLYKLKL